MRATATDAELERVVASFVDRIAREIRVDSVLLFGSYAAGRAGPWSDLDVAVISADFEDVPVYRRQEMLATAAIGTDPRITPIGYSLSELRSLVGPALLREIKSTGRVIYRAANH